jgi:hypothetical protein
MTTADEWNDYVAALRRLATARETEQQRQDRLANNRANAASSASANVKAAADQRQQLEHQVRELEKLAVKTLTDAAVSKQGPRATIALSQISTVDAARRTIQGLTKQLGETVDALHKARRRAREVRDFRRNQLLALGLVVLSLVLLKVAGGTYVDTAIGVVIVIATLLSVKAVARSYLSGLLVAGGVLVVLLVMTGLGAHWWLSLILFVLVIAALGFWSSGMGSKKGK